MEFGSDPRVRLGRYQNDFGASTNPTPCRAQFDEGRMYNMWRSEQCRTLWEQANINKLSKTKKGKNRVAAVNPHVTDKTQEVALPGNHTVKYRTHYQTPMGPISLAVTRDEPNGSFMPTSHQLTSTEISGMQGPTLTPHYKYRR
jgi:hypothetical protein